MFLVYSYPGLEGIVCLCRLSGSFLFGKVGLMVLFWTAVKEVFFMYAYQFGVGIFRVFELWQMYMCRFLLLLCPV